MITRTLVHNLVFLLAHKLPITCQAFSVPRPFPTVTSLQEAVESTPSESSLNPEENPHFDYSATSLEGISYAAVLNRLLKPIFPPSELEKRNALSRTDGYWPFIQTGDDPPQQFTYGEFDFYFFATLLDKAREYYIPMSNSNNHIVGKGWEEKVFCDIGSGTGRLVLAAAALHSWRSCLGIEILPTIHQAALDNYQSYQVILQREQQEKRSNEKEKISSSMISSAAPCEFVCGSFDDPYVYFGDADCIFVFSSCMSRDLLTKLAASIGRQCKPGTVVMTTEFMLPLEGVCEPVENDDRVTSGPYRLELVEKMEGFSWLMGGQSTAYIHRVLAS